MLCVMGPHSRDLSIKIENPIFKSSPTSLANNSVQGYSLSPSKVGPCAYDGGQQ